jgi:uncharacterized protein (TIRG00374 family)
MRDNYGDIGQVLSGTRTGLFLLGLAVFMAAITAATVRLRLIIAAQEMRTTFKEALSLTFIGYFFNNFLPTAIGGDVVKAYYLSRKNHTRKMACYTSIFVDRIIGLLTMVFMAFVALLIAGPQIVDDNIRRVIYLITLFSVLFIIFVTNKDFARKFSVLMIFFKPLKHKMKEAYDAIHQYKHHKVLMAQSLVISVASQLLFFLSLGMLAVSIGSAVPLMELFLRIPIVSCLSLLPSINGLGLREGSMVVFFGPLIGRENAFAVSVLWLFILLIISMIGGVIYGLSPQFRVRMKEIA